MRERGEFRPHDEDGLLESKLLDAVLDDRALEGDDTRHLCVSTNGELSVTPIATCRRSPSYSPQWRRRRRARRHLERSASLRRTSWLPRQRRGSNTWNPVQASSCQLNGAEVGLIAEHHRRSGCSPSIKPAHFREILDVAILFRTPRSAQFSPDNIAAQRKLTPPCSLPGIVLAPSA